MEFVRICSCGPLSMSDHVLVMLTSTHQIDCCRIAFTLHCLKTPLFLQPIKLYFTKFVQFSGTGDMSLEYSEIISQRAYYCTCFLKEKAMKNSWNG